MAVLEKQLVTFKLIYVNTWANAVSRISSSLHNSKLASWKFYVK